MFFAFNHPQLNCRLTLFNYPSFSIESKPAKYWSSFTYSDQSHSWVFANTDEFRQSFIEFDHECINISATNSYPLTMYCLSRHPSDRYMPSSLHTQLPAWRSTLSFLYHEHCSGSFQSEMVLFPSTGSCFSCVPRITSESRREIWLIHASSVCSNSPSPVIVTSFLNSGAVNAQFNLPTFDNCATKLDIPENLFTTDIMLQVLDKSSIPIILDRSDYSISVEHTHPLPSFFPPLHRQGISTHIKKLWSPA